MILLRCTAAGLCDFHRDRAADPGTVADVPVPKCPYYCDAGACRRKATVESRGGRSYCHEHAPGPGRPRTTGSKESKPISFRLGAAERAELARRGEARKQSADQTAKAIVIAALGMVSR